MKFSICIASDYVIRAFGQTTATGLSALREGQLSHARIRRFHAGSLRTSSDLWQRVKPYVRAIQREDGVVILDDCIAKKPYLDENDSICWYYSHSHGSMAKGINFLTALYHSQDISFPVVVTLIAQTEYSVDKKDDTPQRRSPLEKNVSFREMVQQALRNQIAFRYVLNDVWFESAEHMRFIKLEVAKELIMPLKCHHTIVLCVAEKKHGRYVPLETLNLKPHTVREVYPRRSGVSAPSGQAHLRQRRWTYRCGVCGDQRYQPYVGRHHHNLS